MLWKGIFFLFIVVRHKSKCDQVWSKCCGLCCRKNNLVEQLEQFKEKIDDKEDELQQVSAQLEISRKEKLNIENMVKQLEEQREELQVSTVCCISVVVFPGHNWYKWNA